MSKRNECLAYLVKNYSRWPAKTDSPGAATHHGYHWRRPASNAPWTLVSNGDVVFEADYIKHYENNVKMSDHFETVDYGDAISWGLNPDDDITMTFGGAQYRALCVALSRYDGMTAKLKHARKSVRQLTKELGE